MTDDRASRNDFYVELMRSSRGLTPEQAEARERWFEDLAVPAKEDVLFELEMLLKGLVCFADPANHPGPRRSQPVIARDYREELRIARAGCERIAELCRDLLGDAASPRLAGAKLHRVPRDPIGRDLLDATLDQSSPEASLRLLLEAFGNLSDLAEALTNLDHISYQVFSSLEALAGREVGRNAFFNPLVALEFRAEFDRLAHVELLEIVYGARPEGARRAVTLTFLALLRVVRYLEVALRLVRDPSRARLVYLPLAAMRSDSRALTLFLNRDARGWLADGFDRDVTGLSAKEIGGTMDGIVTDFRMLREAGAVLRSTGDRLQLEVRRVFERDFRPLDKPASSAEDLLALEEGLGRLAGFARSCVVDVGRVFDPELSGHRLFVGYPSPADGAARLRRDAWMFSQIVRGFLAKAATAPESVGSWAGTGSFRFVGEFVSYFRSFGVRLLRDLPYQRRTALEGVVEAVAASDVVGSERLDELVAEVEPFRELLLGVHESLEQSPELVDLPFDRREAAETLRLYLDR